LELISWFGWTLLKGIPSFFMNPFVYLLPVLVWMNYRRQILFERKLFSVRINNPWVEIADTVRAGLLPGLIISLVTLCAGLVISPFTMFMVGAIAFLLSCFHVQYLCSAFAGGMVGLLSLAAKHWAWKSSVPVLGYICSKLQEVGIPSLLILMALLHLAEAYLISKNAGKGSSPLLLSGRRGLLVGAYQLQKFWFVPLFAITPSPDHLWPAMLPSWWPFFSDGSMSGVAFALLPAVIGSSDLAMASLPAEKAKQSAKRLFRYSLLLLILGIGSFYLSAMAWVASLFAIVGLELIIRYANWREREKGSIFVQLGRGVRVLAVIPGTPAERLGIEAGEVVVKINGSDVNRAEDIYPALQVNTAFCKMEVLNTAGHSKYLQCTVYQGDHHQLGLILAPDEHAELYVDMKAVNIVRLIRQQIDRGA
jgi:hypothetical protein